MSARNSPADRGAALLTIIMIVSVMSVAAVAAVSSLSRSIDLSRSASNRSQIRLAEQSVLEFGTPLIEHFVAQTINGQLPTEVIPLPFERGLINLTVTDATNCFNLNQFGAQDDSLADARYQKLLVSLGFFEADARALTDSLADWIDADNNPRAYGQESNFYARQSPPYMAANTTLANLSELYAIEGYTTEIVNRISPFICTRPTTEQTPLNIESLQETDASLLVTLFSEEMKVDTAEGLILGRPLDGWGSTEAFLTHPTIIQIGEHVRNDGMISTNSSYIDLHAQINVDSMTRNLTLTYDIFSNTKPILVQRIIGDHP